MGKFVYKFDSVKKAKEMLEKKAQKELSGIHKEIEQLEIEVCRLIIEEAESAKGISFCKKVSEIKVLEDYRNSVKKDIELTNNKIKNLEVQKEKKLNELIEKSKENKILETLEDIHLTNYMNEEKLKEDKQIDEIAVQKFIKEKA